MGRKWFEDKVPALVKLSPTQIQLPAGAHLTIGGQQYHTTAALQLTLTGMAANTLYMVYAVVSSGVVTLVQSTRVNSLGPVGFSSWKLVGALYADNASTPVIGSLVNIVGIPRTERVPYSLTGQTQGLGTLLDQTFFWQRDGGSVLLKGYLQVGTVSAVEARLNLPGVTVHSTKPGGTFLYANHQKVNGTTALHAMIGTAGQGYMRFGGAATGSAIATNAAQNGDTVFTSSAQYEINSDPIPVNEWSDTPLVDL